MWLEVVIFVLFVFCIAVSGFSGQLHCVPVTKKLLQLVESAIA